jgi:hypothetical protein
MSPTKNLIFPRCGKSFSGDEKQIPPPAEAVVVMTTREECHVPKAERVLRTQDCWLRQENPTLTSEPKDVNVGHCVSYLTEN